MNGKGIQHITTHACTDRFGRWLAFVVYTDRTWEYIPHKEF